MWNYIQQVNPLLSETTFGILQGLLSLMIALSSIFAGFISNHFANVSFPIIIGHGFALASCITYFCIEIISDSKTIFFIFFHLLFGFAQGLTGIYKVHIAMASSEKDRAKAIGFATFAPAFGYLIGALLQLGFTQLKYPGPKLFLNIHLNLYTAPAILMVILYVISLILLFTIFDGKMKIPPAEIKLDNKTEIVEIIPNDGKASYDKIAVIFLLFTTVSLNFAAMNPSV